MKRKVYIVVVLIVAFGIFVFLPQHAQAGQVGVNGACTVFSFFPFSDKEDEKGSDGNGKESDDGDKEEEGPKTDDNNSDGGDGGDDDHEDHEEEIDSPESQQRSIAVTAKEAFSYLAATQLAMDHFNTRNASVVPELANLGACNVHFPPQIVRDTEVDETSCVRSLWDATFEQRQTSPDEKFCAVLGPKNNHPVPDVAAVTNALEIPLLLYYADYREVVDGHASDYTAATIVTPKRRARFIAEYLQRPGFRRDYLSIIYTSPYGTGHLAEAIVDIADDYDLVVHTFEYDKKPKDISHDEHVGLLLDRMATVGIKTIMINVHDMNYLQELAEGFAKRNMLTNEYLYILTTELAPINIEEAHGTKKEGSYLDQLFAGALVFEVVDLYRVDGDTDPFLQAWRSQDAAFVERINNMHPLAPTHPYYFQAESDFFQTNYPPSHTSFAYDAIINLGIGGCVYEMESNEFLPCADYMEALDEKEFHGENESAGPDENEKPEGDDGEADSDEQGQGPPEGDGNGGRKPDDQQRDDEQGKRNGDQHGQQPDDTQTDGQPNNSKQSGDHLSDDLQPEGQQGDDDQEKSQSSNDPQPKGQQTSDPQPEDEQTSDPQPEDEQTSDPQPEDQQTDDPQPEDQQTNDPQPKDPQTNDPQPEDQSSDREQGSSQPSDSEQPGDEEEDGQSAGEKDGDSQLPFFLIPPPPPPPPTEEPSKVENDSDGDSQLPFFMRPPPAGEPSDEGNSGDGNASGQSPPPPENHNDGAGQGQYPTPPVRQRLLDADEDEPGGPGPEGSGKGKPSFDSLVDGIRSSCFKGASGPVVYEGIEEATRASYYVTMGLYNIRPGETGTDGRLSYSSVLVSLNKEGSGWQEIEGEAFVYRSGSTTPPAVTREVWDANYLEPAVRAIGLLLWAMTAFTGVVGICAIWILRKDTIVQRSQPVFMALLCLGSMIMGCAIFTLSWDENSGASEHQLDLACTVTPWFFFIGHITSFAALFTKLWRVDQVMQFRRRAVTIRTVIGPLIGLLTATIAVLLLWTFLDPWTWERVWISQIPAVTYGECHSEHMLAFFFPLMALLVAAEGCAAYFAYKTSDIPEDFRDTSTVLYAIVCHLQAWGLGVPILAVLGTSSVDAMYFGRVFLIWIFSMSSILVVVSPKIYRAIRVRINPNWRNNTRVKVSGVYDASGGSNNLSSSNNQARPSSSTTTTGRTNSGNDAGPVLPESARR